MIQKEGGGDWPPSTHSGHHRAIGVSAGRRPLRQLEQLWEWVMTRTMLLILLSAQAVSADAMQAGPRTRDYVNSVMGTPSLSDYPPFSAERMGTAQYRRCIAADSSNVHESWCLDAESKRQDARLKQI